jgi:S-adenosyl-L-methionine hydrolase (adenosine-forming)
VPPSKRRSRRARVVTLSSDLGAAYAAQMKAVLAHSVPPGRLVDLAHDLRPHDVGEAAFIVRAMAERFPAGSIHVVVVDPGVGGERVPVAVACRDGSVVIGPDNGVLVPLVDALGGGRAYRIDPELLRAGSRLGRTFDGRDVFAPAAARVAVGSPPAHLGPPVPLFRPGRKAPRRGAKSASGTVAHVDRFGNVITDVPSAWAPQGAEVVFVRTGRTARRLPFVTSYEAAGPGRLAVLGSSFGTLELAVGTGRAADRLRAVVGDHVGFRWPVARRRPAAETVSKHRPR